MTAAHRPDTLTITRPDDWHLHVRDGDPLHTVVPHTAAQFGRAIIMPNLRPPVTTAAQALDYKQRILAEADAASTQSGAIGALLRREGLYSSHLAAWRRERQAGILRGLTPHKRGPKPKRSPREEEIQRLRRENQRLAEQLRKAEIVIDVQKKVGALLGWPLPKADPGEKP